MTSEDWQRVQACFEQILDVPAAERPQSLAAIGDAELRREVESLLHAHRDAGAFLDEPDQFFSKDSFKADTLSPRDLIDRYRIIREIGRGGMGAVYLAERADDEYRKQVAIKVIKRGTDTDSVLRHFRNERQILASLEHPNIARLLDGGTTGDGLPYFVMEYIEGERIDQYAKQKSLSITERLQLFRQVCGAVSYAHQNLIVHRDLKPSNVLVTAEGVPKLLDFGIAKIIQAGDGADALATITAMPAMTPEYASPEQIEGAPATTLSDVYSLGVILYELLAGQKPFGAKARTRDEISRAVMQQEPKRPSTTVGKANGSSKSQASSSKLLRGDLDNIVLMAMRRETARRYRSVEQFSNDILRHLEARPVLARKDTFGYRSAKFVRRNKAALAAGGLVLVMLIGGIIATSWQARIAMREKARAERRFNEVRKLANSVLFDYHDAIRALPGATKVRERLVKDALNYLDSLATEAHGDPALQNELAAAYDRVGDVRGGAADGSLGDLSGAIESYTKALRIREALVAAKPDDAQARRGLANSHDKIGSRLLETAEAGKGLEHLRQALTLRLELTREQPARDDLQLGLAYTRNQLGLGLSERGDFAGALEQNRAALAICEKLVARHPRDPRYRRAMWSSQDKIGTVLYRLGDIAGAIEANSKARALVEALLLEDPINGDYRGILVVTCQNGGDIRKRSDKRGALELFRKAAALSEELLAADPLNSLTRKDLAYTEERIADTLVDLEDNSQALLYFSKALEHYAKVAKEAPADVNVRLEVAACHAGAACMHARLGEVDPAVEERRKAIAVLQEPTGDNPNHIGGAQAYSYLGYAYLAMAEARKDSETESRQQRTAARDMFRQSLSILDDLRSRQGTLGENEEWAGQIASEIAKCDAALGR